MSKPVILILTSYYYPGFKAGGPIRSILNLVQHLSDTFEFKVITRDRDLGDTAPYDQVNINEWIQVEGVKVFYLPKSECTIRNLRNLILEAQPDVLYLNSFLDPYFTIKPLLLRRLGLLPEIKVVLAPRGEFAQGAMALKVRKKKTFMFIAKLGGVYRRLTWQASSDSELKDIKGWVGDDASIYVACNLPPRIMPDNLGARNKVKEILCVVTVARIARNKNIDGALRILSGVESNIDYHLYGPSEDRVYWKECQNIIDNLPGNIKVTYHGQIPHEQISLELLDYDLFFLPTHGENFGHVILEAFAAGLPVLISDLTPWKDLERKGVGWDISINCPDRFKTILDECAGMDADEYKGIKEKVCAYAENVINDKNIVQQNENLFRQAMASS